MGTPHAVVIRPLQNQRFKALLRLTAAVMAGALIAACGGGGGVSGVNGGDVGGGGGGAPPAAPVALVTVAAAPTVSRVGISGTAQVGQALTGIYTYGDANNDAEGVSTFRWLRGGAAIAGATGTTYTLITADQGNAIAFEVTPVSTVTPTTGLAASSDQTATIPFDGAPVAQAPPSASSVAIGGSAQVGGVLTGAYVYADANGDLQGVSTFRWLRNDVAVTGATAVSYRPVAADQGATITFEVTPVSSAAPFVGSTVASSATVAVVAAPKSVAMKLLVISAEGTLPSYQATVSILDQIGVPHDRIVLKGPNATLLQMGAGTLSDGLNSGKYQGIILETGDLAAFNLQTNNYPSAMTASQWAMLRQYQVDFGVRSATMYTRPASTIDASGVSLDLTYGLIDAVENSAAGAPLDGTFTSSGKQTFSYLNTGKALTIKSGVFSYRATPASAATVPLLQTSDLKALASVYTAPAGWQNLALAADNSPELTHTLLLGYGVVNWVSKGLFLGERKIYMSAQADDVFIPDFLWDPATLTTPATEAFRWRNDATDYTSLVAWQTALRTNTQTAAFRLELAFNGVGYNTNQSRHLNLAGTDASGGSLYFPDTLSGAVRLNPDAFRWVSHTWDHSSLDPVVGAVTPTVASILDQLTWNHAVATGVPSGTDPSATTPVTFANYSKNALVQPVISGLENPVFWEAARTFGIKYILLDTSKGYNFLSPARPPGAPPRPAPSPNTGYSSSLDLSASGNRIFIIPRYPTNLFYNVSTPAELVSEYNSFYAGAVPGGIGHVSTYEQILEQESEVLVRYMLKFNANSWMFHAANLRDYDGSGSNNKSLLSDLLDAVVTKFKDMYSLPMLSPSQSEIGAIMEARMAYNAAVAGGLIGRIVSDPLLPTRIELTNASGAPVDVPVTGVNSGGTIYGGQAISKISLAAGASRTLVTP